MVQAAAKPFDVPWKIKSLILDIGDKSNLFDAPECTLISRDCNEDAHM